MISKQMKKSICMLLVVAMCLTGCGDAASAAGDDKTTLNDLVEWTNSLGSSDQGSGTTNGGVGSDNSGYSNIDRNSEISDNGNKAQVKGEWNKNARPAGKWDGTTKDNKSVGDGFEILFSLQNTWEGGFTANVSIKNTGSKKITKWELTFDYPGEFSDCWNAEKTQSGHTYTFKNVDWNGTIEVGQTAEFGFNGKSDFEGFPETYQLVKTEDGSGNSESATATSAPWGGDSSAPTQTSSPGTGNDPSATVTPGTGNDPNVTADPNAGTTPDDGSGDIGGSDDVSGNVVSGTVKKHGRLKVKGRYIVDKKGKKFLIKGPSTHGIAWFPEFVNKAAFNSCKKWGANTVRLACYSSEGEGYNTDSVWDTIDKGVKAATELGMYVIIDWHILNENKPMMSYDRAKVFFKHFAKKYGKRKNVIWEICNEPNGCEWAADIKPYAKKIIPLIRKYSQNIIVVGTPTWSQDVDVVANDRLTGKYKKNVCYTLHFYAATHKDDLRNRVKTAIGKGLPILCTEFSICEASGAGTLDTSSGNAWISLLRKNGIGYVSWSLCNKDEAASLLLPSCQRTGGFKKSDLSPTGKWVISKWK